MVISSTGVTESIDDRNRKMEDIKVEKDELKVILGLYSSVTIVMQGLLILTISLFLHVHMFYVCEFVF